MKGQTIFEPNFKKIHNILLVFVVFLVISALFYSAFFTDGIKQAKAGVSQNISGWAWGDNFGWINFNPSFGGVTVTPTTVPSVDLTANPTSVAVGENSTISWTSANATSCE